MKLIKGLLILIGGIYLLQNPVILEKGYHWSQEQVYKLKESVFDKQKEIIPSSKPISTSEQINDDVAIDDLVSQSSVKWPRKDLNVYYDIEPTLNKDYQSSWRQAVLNWNNLDIVRLNKVDKEEQADIVLQVDNRSNTNQAGVTQNRYMTNFLNEHQTLVHATAKINQYYLDHYSYDGKVNTAEHELGHALGLQHDDEHNSVMNSAGSQFGIQQVDVANLTKLYN